MFHTSVSENIQWQDISMKNEQKETNSLLFI